MSVVASNTGDQEKLTYQWYSNTIKSTVGAEAVENGNVDTVEITISPNDTKYFYCVVTSTIEDNQYVIPTSVTSDIVKVAYLQQPQRTLEKIIADFNKTYMLLDSFDYTDFSVTEYYDDNTTTMVKSLDGSYIVTIPERSIGNVPVTITNSSKPEITTTIEIPVKYQLDASNLSITGNPSVEQNGTLSLTANYAAASGAITYKKYDTGSSTTYNVKDNVTVTWTGGATGNSWTATANTQTTGQQTATVKLTSKDEWCVTTSEITASHEYEVTAATTAGGITDENSLLEAINQAQDGDSITIPNEITITNTITVNKNIIIDGNKTGTLFRSNKGTITGPMFEVSNSGNLTLQNITLDGQYNNDFYGGGNNPFIINNGGTLTVSSSTLTNNRMSPTGAAYGSIPQLYASAAIYSAGTTVITKSEISDVSSNNNTKGIVYGVTGSLTIIDTNITLPTSYNGNALYLESAVSYNINNKDSGLSQSYKSITPDSP